MQLTRAQEVLIRGVVSTLRAAADTLASLIVRDEPTDQPKCPQCGNTDLAEAGDVLVCSRCNHNLSI